MTKKSAQKEKTSLYERAGMRTILKEEYREKEKYVEIRTYSGAIVILHIPYHTEEEEAKIGSDFTDAAFRMCFPDDDPANYKSIRIVP